MNEYKIIYQPVGSINGQWQVTRETFPTEDAAIDWAINHSNLDVNIWHVAIIDKQ